MVATSEKKRNGHYATVSLKAAEWGRANGYGRLLDDLKAFSAAWRTQNKVTYSTDGHYVRLTPEKLTRLFNKYQRLAETVRHYMPQEAV